MELYAPECRRQRRDFTCETRPYLADTGLSTHLTLITISVLPIQSLLQNHDSHISPDSSLGTVKVKKSKKRLADIKSFSLEEPLLGDVGEKAERVGGLTRSKTYDHPSSLRILENDPSAERRRSITSNLPKHNVSFHKIFREVHEDEELIDSKICNR
ncbi:unnamed protein product [Ranitomeya imitator]|uniref:Uncharacterized protein n=1 Tax=Ranitomeya imitator TaxID=111125 RepID=A0ABN9M9T9_9NEOB|nr:unnamed protein product [Ranitomeya imitator]